MTSNTASSNNTIGSKLAAFEATIHQNNANGGCQDKSFIGTLLMSSSSKSPMKKPQGAPVATCREVSSMAAAYPESPEKAGGEERTTTSDKQANAKLVAPSSNKTSPEPVKEKEPKAAQDDPILKKKEERGEITLSVAPPKADDTPQVMPDSVLPEAPFLAPTPPDQQQLQTYKARLATALQEKEEHHQVSRVLRLEVVTLREQLEAAHQKIETQRQELNNVAARMKDHSGRLMELLAAGEARHVQELREQKVFYERLLGETQKPCDGRIANEQMNSKAAVTREAPDITDKTPRTTMASAQPETAPAHEGKIKEPEDKALSSQQPQIGSSSEAAELELSVVSELSTAIATECSETKDMTSPVEMEEEQKETKDENLGSSSECTEAATAAHSYASEQTKLFVGPLSSKASFPAKQQLQEKQDGNYDGEVLSPSTDIICWKSSPEQQQQRVDMEVDAVVVTSFYKQRALAANRRMAPQRNLSGSLQNATTLAERMAALSEAAKTKKKDNEATTQSSGDDSNKEVAKENKEVQRVIPGRRISDSLKNASTLKQRMEALSEQQCQEAAAAKAAALAPDLAQKRRAVVADINSRDEQEKISSASFSDKVDTQPSAPRQETAITHSSLDKQDTEPSKPQRDAINESSPEEIRPSSTDDDSESDLNEDATQAVVAVVSSAIVPAVEDAAAYKVSEAEFTSYEKQRMLAARRAAPARQLSDSLKGATSLKDRMASFTKKEPATRTPPIKATPHQTRIDKTNSDTSSLSLPPSEPLKTMPPPPRRRGSFMSFASSDSSCRSLGSCNSILDELNQSTGSIILDEISESQDDTSEQGQTGAQDDTSEQGPVVVKATAPITSGAAATEEISARMEQRMQLLERMQRWPAQNELDPVVVLDNSPDDHSEGGESFAPSHSFYWAPVEDSSVTSFVSDTEGGEDIVLSSDKAPLKRQGSTVASDSSSSEDVEDTSAGSDDLEVTSDGSDESDSLSESHSHTQTESAGLSNPDSIAEDDDSESDLDEDTVQAAAEAVAHTSRRSETTGDEKAYKVVEAEYTSYEMQRKMAAKRAAPARKLSGSLKGSMSLRDRMASFTKR